MEEQEVGMQREWAGVRRAAPVGEGFNATVTTQRE